jgi:hypothetical protein
MNKAKYVARPLNALNRVFGSVDAVRNSRVVYALQATFAGAGLLLPAAVVVAGTATLSLPLRHARQRQVYAALLMSVVSGLEALVRAPVVPSPYRQAALAGGGGVFMLALALSAPVNLRGTCSVDLALEGRDEAVSA